MKHRWGVCAADHNEELVIRGARLAIAPDRSEEGDLQISRGRIEAIQTRNHHLSSTPQCIELDLTGLLILPGLINAHDHLEFALYPRLGNPPYRNYIEWGEDIHAKFGSLISKHHTVPKEVRLWWGGIRNLLCGATTVCHHNPLYSELRRPNFPVRVVQHYGWAHSLALGGDLRAARATTPKGRPFFVHACEGVDVGARDELRILDELGILDEFAVLVHGLALSKEDVEQIRVRNASLILCPSSNYFLFGELPPIGLLEETDRIALGSDSPLTATGDLLDEIRFFIHKCGTDPCKALQMVTSDAAEILRLNESEGSLRESGVADLVGVRDLGCNAAERLLTASMEEIEIVILGGTVQLVSEAIRDRVPASIMRGLERLVIGSSVRWVRAPVGELLQNAEEALGEGQVRLGGRAIRSDACVGVTHAQ